MKNTLCAIAMLGAVACANAPGQTLLYNESTPGSSYYNPSVPTTIVFDDVPIPTSRLGGNTWVSVQTVTVGIFQAAYAPATNVDVYWTTMTTTVTPPDTQIDTPPTLIGTVLLPANGGAWTITPVTLSTPLWNLAVPLNLSIYAGYGTFSIGVRLSSTAWNVGWMLGAGPDANWDGFWQYDPNANPPETVWWFSGNPFAAFYISVVGTPFTPPSACCFSNGSCQMLVPGVCTLIGGISLAYPSTCTPNNPCPQPGACCVAATGECYMSTITAPGDCDPNDTYWGDGSTCTPNNPCPQPPPGGACCYPDGSCAVTTQADCTGAWLGAGTTCSPADRCQWPDAGACCHPNGSCNMTLEPACTTSGGTWLGSESNCSPNLCEEGSGSIRTWGDCSWPWYQCLVPEPNSNFVAVAAGFAHSLGLKADGSIVGWGLNSDGQCSVPSPNSNFVAVAAGAYHSLGLKADGSIVAWGWNSNGQCDVPASNSGFRAIAGGGIHSLGLKANGSIVAWGYNGSGECNVPYLNTGFVAVAAGGDSSCGGQSLGLKANGTIVAWGYNGAGQCNVPEPNTGFVAIAAAVADSLGLKDDGSIVAWGWYLTSVPQPNTGFVAVCAGSRAAHCFGLRADGSIVAWGWNDYGQCNVPEPNVGFVAATGGVWHSLGLLNPQPPKGACCQPDGSCSVTTQAACTGVWQGAGTTCSPNPCPQPNGACCLSDGVCLPDISESECLAQSGIWQGPGSTCDPNPCLPAQLTVPATANIFGAGHAVPPAPGGGGGGVLPTVYYLPPGAGRVLTFSGIAGAVACCGEDPWMGPDGRRGSATNISSWQGISGIVHGAAQLFLVGVFLGDSEPVDPAPPRLDCTVDNFLVLAPQIAQTFYIGDGLTGTGSGEVQQFLVPDGATRLYLGFADAYNFDGSPGWYGDNAGALTIGSVSVSGAGEAVVYDHFDDGALDPLWNVSFQDATGWTYVETGTELTATDISPAVMNTSAIVSLTRAVPAIANFHLDFDLAWDSEGSVKAMQFLLVWLYGANGEVVAAAGYEDGWVAYAGEAVAAAGSSGWATGMDSLPLSGSASVDIDRTGGTVTIRWNGTYVLSGDSTTPVETVTIQFWYYPYDGWDGPSFFGSESIDLVALYSETGACCLGDGTCDVLTAGACTAAGGTYQGNGTACDPNPCPLTGDLNCDAAVDFGDINPFVLYLSNFTAWQAAYPECPPENGDINGDGDYPSFGDINPFVALLTGGG